MGIKCPRCGGKETHATAPGRMLCDDCSKSWKPSPHLGKKMKNVGDGILSPRRKVMRGAKTEKVGNAAWGFKRVKKTRKKTGFFGL